MASLRTQSSGPLEVRDPVPQASANGGKVVKTLATVFCAAVVGAQVFAVITAPGGKYWPFLNYPMYDEAHWAGDQFSAIKLFAVPCDSAEARPLSSNELHMTQFPYRDALNRATMALPRVANRAAEELRQQIVHHIDHPMCRLEVHRKIYTVGSRGFEMPGEPWRVERAWILTPSAAIPAPDAPGVSGWQ